MKYIIPFMILISSFSANALSLHCESGDHAAQANFDMYMFAGKTPVRFLHNVSVNNMPIFDSPVGWENSFKGGPIEIAENATIEFVNEVAFLQVDQKNYEMSCAPKFQ